MRNTSIYLIGLSLLCAGVCAQAICPPGVQFFRYVGDTSNSQCTDATIQAAIDAVICPATTVVVTNSGWSNQHLTIVGKSFTLAGTSGGCGSIGSTGSGGATPTTPQATITGNGSQSVLDISGNSNILIEYLEISGGGGGSGSQGGGIYFHGSGELTLTASTIDSNKADFGGGIAMDGIGGNATLFLSDYSVIESNIASSNGGGIHIQGATELLTFAPHVHIAFNHAPNGLGGGVAVVSPARADIASPGFESLPVIDGNTAARGGGMSAQIPDDATDNAVINLTNGDPLHPVSVSANFASLAGGGIYLISNTSVSNFTARACAADFRIDGNQAPDGAAIYADADSALDFAQESVVILNDPNFCAIGFGSSSTPCAHGVACNTMNDNITADAGNHPTTGSIVLMNAGGILLGDRFAMRNNHGAHAIHMIDPGSDDNIGSTFLRNCLIADNTFTAEMLYLDQDEEINIDVPVVNIDECTIANNAHNSGSVIHSGQDISVSRSILDQPFMSAVNLGVSATVKASNVLASDVTGLPPAQSVQQGEPLFENAAAGNYHQGAFLNGNGSVTVSPGIDYAPTGSTTDIDLEGNHRGVDVPAALDFLGRRDIGCYEERPIADRIFADALGDPISLVL